MQVICRRCVTSDVSWSVGHSDCRCVRVSLHSRERRRCLVCFRVSCVASGCVHAACRLAHRSHSGEGETVCLWSVVSLKRCHTRGRPGGAGGTTDRTGGLLDQQVVRDLGACM